MRSIAILGLLFFVWLSGIRTSGPDGSVIHLDSGLPVLINQGGITLGNHIFVHPDMDITEPYFLTHELIHVEQWRRLGVIKFLTQYLGQYFRCRRHFEHAACYHSLDLEREAYEKQ